MAFPDALSNVQDAVTSIIAAHINNIEATIGITNSSVNTSLNYKMSNLRAGEKVWEIGDIKATIWNTVQVGWLLMNGDTIGNVGSGATHTSADYQTLFGYLQTKFGLTPTDTWANGGKMTVPDMATLNKSLIGAGGTIALGSSGGTTAINLAHTHTVASHYHTTATHALTSNEMPVHTHTQDAHTHTQDPHKHTFSLNIASDRSDPGSGSHVYSTYNNNASLMNNATATNQNATATNQNTGGDSAHGHGNTGAATPATDSMLSATQSILNPYLAVNFLIKY